jgi:hypothetical protein
MTPEAVKLEVDCVIGIGECDDLGKQFADYIVYKNALYRPVSRDL